MHAASDALKILSYKLGRGTAPVDKPATIASAIALGTVGVLSLNVQTGLVQGGVSELCLGPAAANEAVFSEMSGVAIASALPVVSARHIDWRLIVAGSLAVSVLDNCAFAAVGDPILFIAARHGSGFGEGGIIAMGLIDIRLTRKAERSLALCLVLLLTCGALEFGVAGIIETMISAEIALFGGIKESGVGWEGAHCGVDDCTEPKYCSLGGLSP